MYHANLLGFLAGRLAGIPHIIWSIRAANARPSSYSRLTRSVIWLGARLSHFPAAITVNSETGKLLHGSWGYDMRKMVLIPNGFDLQMFKPDPAARRSVRAELGVTQDSILVGSMARFHPAKDHANFFRSAGLLQLRFPSVHFVLSGDDISIRNQALARMIRENRLDGKVHLLGPRQDVPRVMAALDIFCLSSATEAFPNVVGEAMACGVPCVVTDVGDSALIVSDTGHVVPPRSPEALAEACAQLIALDAATRWELGRNARMRIERAFGIASMVHSYEKLYEDIAIQVDSQTAYSVAN